MSGNREYKSDVFSMLMEDKRYALDVYNALNDSDYKDPNLVMIVKLEKGVSLSVRNDAAFIVDMNFSFYEHQSTYNPNMPLRELIYYVNTIEDMLKENKRDIYSRKLIQLPTPHFAVFYNGKEKRSEHEIMRLSDSFYHSTENPEMEMICHVYNINTGYNEDLKKKSQVLHGYMYFVNEVNEKKEQGYDLDKAVDISIEKCIENHILEDFFEARKDEVKKMTHLDYTFEKREPLIREEGYNDGHAIGLQSGRIQAVCNMISLGIPEQTILTMYSMEEYHRAQENLKVTSEF